MDVSFGQNALQSTGQKLPLQVLASQAGYYIGTADDEGPVSRESDRYYQTPQQAYDAMRAGNWIQHFD